jgi:hypothetical protein
MGVLLGSGRADASIRGVAFDLTSHQQAIREGVALK